MNPARETPDRGEVKGAIPTGGGAPAAGAVGRGADRADEARIVTRKFREFTEVEIYVRDFFAKVVISSDGKILHWWAEGPEPAPYSVDADKGLEGAKPREFRVEI